MNNAMLPFAASFVPSPGEKFRPTARLPLLQATPCITEPWRGCCKRRPQYRGSASWAQAARSNYAERLPRSSAFVSAWKESSFAAGG